MLQDIITYLKKPGNIKRVMPELELINDSYRFDSRRFDILACILPESRFYGIDALKADAGFRELSKMVKDAEWLQKYRGALITLIPASEKKLHNVFSDEERSGIIVPKYYTLLGKDYVFMDTMAEYNSMQKSHIQDTASRIITSPQIVDFFLKQLEKKSPAIQFARQAYKAYTKIKK